MCAALFRAVNAFLVPVPGGGGDFGLACVEYFALGVGLLALVANVLTVLPIKLNRALALIIGVNVKTNATVLTWRA